MPGPYVLDVTTTDNYQYLCCPESTQVTIQVYNAAAYVGFGQTDIAHYFTKGSGSYPAQDEPYAPTIGGLARRTDEIRVKSYKPGTPARVVVIAQ